jgi:hypothetical protein
MPGAGASSVPSKRMKETETNLITKRMGMSPKIPITSFLIFGTITIPFLPPTPSIKSILTASVTNIVWRSMRDPNPLTISTPGQGS